MSYDIMTKSQDGRSGSFVLKFLPLTNFGSVPSYIFGSINIHMFNACGMVYRKYTLFGVLNRISVWNMQLFQNNI